MQCTHSKSTCTSPRHKHPTNILFCNSKTIPFIKAKVGMCAFLVNIKLEPTNALQALPYNASTLHLHALLLITIIKPIFYFVIFKKQYTSLSLIEPR